MMNSTKYEKMMMTHACAATYVMGKLKPDSILGSKHPYKNEMK